MEFLFELIFSIPEFFAEIWTNFIKKRWPNYDNNRIIMTLGIITGILIFLITTALILGIFFYIEWLFPELLDIVEF